MAPGNSRYNGQGAGKHGGWLSQAHAGSPPDNSNLSKLWRWLDTGCPTPTNSSESLQRFAKSLAEAASADDPVLVGARTFHPSPWVRLAAAANPHCPPWAIWGDGVSDLGLMSDKNVWVRAAAVANAPKPPFSTLAAIAAALHEPKPATPPPDAFLAEVFAAAN